MKPSLLAVLALLLGACVPLAASPSAPSRTGASPLPTATTPAHCVYRFAADGEPLPDPSCTPGATNPDVSAATLRTTVCARGWTATVRPPVSYTEPLKAQLMGAYATPSPAARTELDHLIPLELGGAPAAVANLWPELPDPPALAAGGSGTGNRKDQLENVARQAVCNGSLDLAMAQRTIAADWTQLAAMLHVN